MAQKYASELQELADLLIGGKCVPAPFRELKQRVRDLLEAERERDEAVRMWGRIDCGFRDPDHLCGHPSNMTPECHPWACPLVGQPRVSEPNNIVSQPGGERKPTATAPDSVAR